MGMNFSYLDKPVTDKESFDNSNEKLVCGASSMQGWRLSQEVNKDLLLSIYISIYLVLGCSQLYFGF